MGAVVASLGSGAGCALLGKGPVDLVPFGDFVVRETGGEDGRDIPLLVSADGTALLVGRSPAAGRLSEQKMSRLQELLESERLRREAANPPEDEERSTCADGVVVTITMGSLTVRNGETCGGSGRATPAFDEVLALLEDARDGEFDAPLSDEIPPLPSLRLDRKGFEDEPDLTITVAPNGSARLTPATKGSRTPRAEMLEPEQRDALRLVLDQGLSERVPVSSCDDSAATYTIHEGAEAGVTVEACSSKSAEQALVILVIEQTFDLD